MGLFRRMRRRQHKPLAEDQTSSTPAVSPPAAAAVVEEQQPTLKVVILEFPPNFDPTTAAPVSRRVMFQHETHSVISGFSNCSCRMQHGCRRPECCVECHEQKEQAMMQHNKPRRRPSTTDPSVTADPANTAEGTATMEKPEPPEPAKTNNTPKTIAKVVLPPPTAIGLISKMMIAPSLSRKKSKSMNTTPTSATSTSPLLVVASSGSGSSSSTRNNKHHKKSQSVDTAGGFSFLGVGKNLNAVFCGHESLTFTAEGLSLDHELS